jgi:hypothetical protein
MRQNHRKTFREILREEAPRNAWKLETKARTASWLAKIQPRCSSKLYSIKHAAVRQLFRISEHAPSIGDAWTTGRGFLLSVRLVRTGSLLHVPFDALRVTTQQTHGAWVARRARGRYWQRLTPRIHRFARRPECAFPIRSPW